MEEQKRYSRDIGEGVRQFVAVSAGIALKQVREELGPDALIINQAQVGDRVIIEAALELPEIAEEAAVEVELELPNPEEESSSVPAKEIRVAGIPIRDLRGCFRFVGGSGVGKTSLVIKAAVEYAMCHGTQGLLVLATDQERLAGTEQLELGCQMLGIQLVTRAPSELPSAISAYGQKDLVLIDTTAAEIINPEPVIGVNDVFVCSNEHSVPSLEAQRQICGRTRYTVVTHMDRPSDCQATGEWLVNTDQELLFLGASGYLPEGLESATQASVAERFFGLQAESDTRVSIAV